MASDVAMNDIEYLLRDLKQSARNETIVRSHHVLVAGKVHALIQSQVEQIERLRDRIERYEAFEKNLWERNVGIQQRAETAEAELTQLRADNERMREALEPFAVGKLPSSTRSEVDYDQFGLRRSISPLEIARRDAFFALHPEKHPLAQRAARSALTTQGGADEAE